MEKVSYGAYQAAVKVNPQNLRYATPNFYPVTRMEKENPELAGLHDAENSLFAITSAMNGIMVQIYNLRDEIEAADNIDVKEALERRHITLMDATMNLEIQQEAAKEKCAKLRGDYLRKTERSA